MLPKDWWIRWRDRDPVEDKLARAHVKHWVTVLDEALKRNRQAGREPSTWEGFADAIHRDWANFSRRKAGSHARLSPQEFLAMASAVGKPASAIFPETHTWIARATELLCSNSISREEADIYGRFCLVHLQVDRITAVEQVAKQHCNGDRSKVEKAVNRVTEHLTDVLADLCKESA